MSIYEYAQVEASFLASHNEIFNCEKCLSQETDQVRMNFRREQKGCFKRQNRLIYHGLNIKFYLCPGNYRDPGFWYLYNEFLTYEKRGFEADKSPAKLVEALNYIDALKKDLEVKQLQKQKRSHGRRNQNRRNR